MIKCPMCFAELPKDRFLYACVGGCQEVSDTQLSRTLGVAATTKPLTVATHGADRGAVSCRFCHQNTVEVCASCHSPLPDGWRNGDTLCVALAGPRSSGKTNYIAVLVQALRKFSEDMNSAFEFASAAGYDSYQDTYFKPLYEQLGVLPATPVGNAQGGSRTPIILTLKRPRRPIFISLRDVAGEDMEKADDPSYLGFFANASLIVFLFDPVRVPNVRDIVHDLIPVNRTGGDPEMVFTHLLRLVGPGRPRLAMCLSKFDVMWSIGDLGFKSDGALGASELLPQVMSNLGAGFRRDHRVRDISQAKADIDLIDQEIRSLLVLLRATNIVTTVTSSGLPARFFAMSALGHPPDSTGLNPHGIAPYRVLDPLVWAMLEERMLP